MKKHSLQAFTLIELVVAVTILSVIMLSVFVIYMNLVNVNRKIDQTRILQEQTKLITETIASDVRGSGIDFTKTTENELFTKSGNRYLLQQDSGGGYSQCNLDKKYPCQVMSKLESPLTNTSVDIRNLRFYTTGKTGSGATNEDLEGKVQIVFDIGLARAKGITSEIADASVITIQTTISEKIYKDN